MAFIVGNMTDLEFAKHILDAAYLLEGSYSEAIDTVIKSYGVDVLLEAWSLHLDCVLTNMYGDMEGVAKL